MLALLQLADRGHHGGEMDVVHLEAAADAGEQRDGQLAAEMFAEFLEPLQHHRVPVGPRVQQFVGEEIETQLLDQVQNPVCLRGLQVSHAT